MVNQVKGIMNKEDNVILEGSNVKVTVTDTAEVLIGNMIKTSGKELQLEVDDDVIRLLQLDKIDVEMV